MKEPSLLRQFQHHSIGARARVRIASCTVTYSARSRGEKYSFSSVLRSMNGNEYALSRI